MKIISHAGHRKFTKCNFCNKEGWMKNYWTEDCKMVWSCKNCVEERWNNGL